MFKEYLRLKKDYAEEFSPEWQKRRMEKLTENTKRLNEQGLNYSDLIAVRAIHNKDYNVARDKMYASPSRPTIHFSLNGLVGDVGGGGRQKRRSHVVKCRHSFFKPL